MKSGGKAPGGKGFPQPGQAQRGKPLTFQTLNKEQGRELKSNIGMNGEGYMLKQAELDKLKSALPNVQWEVTEYNHIQGKWIKKTGLLETDIYIHIWYNGVTFGGKVNYQTVKGIPIQFGFELMTSERFDVFCRGIASRICVVGENLISVTAPITNGH